MPDVLREETVFLPGWDLDDLLKWVLANQPTIDQDNDRQIIIYTGLYQTADGSLVERK
jgi:hypothetical protein